MCELAMHTKCRALNFWMQRVGGKSQTDDVEIGRELSRPKMVNLSR